MNIGDIGLGGESQLILVAEYLLITVRWLFTAKDYAKEK